MNLRLLLITITLALITASSSQVFSKPTKDYAIEIIIFVNQDGLQQTAEQFSANHIIPIATNGLDLDSADNTTDWQPIAEENFILNNVVEKLKRSGRYRVLKHIAWRQPAVDKNDALPISIHAGRDFSEIYPERAYKQIEFSDTTNQTKLNTNSVRELAGTINVVITRYIHIYSDLVYRLPRTNPSYIEDPLKRDKILVDYAVNSHRRMRSRELHYIDHPIVGIIVEATPINDE